MQSNENSTKNVKILLNHITETKVSDSNCAGNLKYFCEKYNLKGIQLVKEIGMEKSMKNIDIMNTKSYLRQLVL
jgi:hypothetical protein